MTHNPLDKINALDAIEKDIILCLQSAGQALQELGKEKSSLKAAENHTQLFIKSLQSVESKLSEQINYLTQVSTGQPHEGSGYASTKVLQMAWHRIHHARSKVRELEDCKAKYTQHAAARQQQRPGEFFNQQQ
ncbi:mediator of RNA polymerase II transcription subunit 11 [Condylostylus longicornis]|uniref:mediator of RNA polymerase II transcription subunit 11 n=1 Tax=Condylostylus longicornis TaxID=2530218 RepID=UPI00244E05CC|nr:mediator of RNA polymerase II transcription subunit 11 [Condylostylus longicornis]